MIKPLTEILNDVFVSPTQITFGPDSRGSFSPTEILILNKSKLALRYKVLCTARTSYSLSKCKGFLKPGEIIKIAVGLARNISERSRRDYFKVQFFDRFNDSLRGERLISSSVWSTEAAYASFQALDSDSCTSCPNRDTDNCFAFSNTRAISLTRPFDTFSTGTDRSLRDSSFERTASLRSGHGDSRTIAKQSYKPRPTTASKKQPIYALPAPLPKGNSHSRFDRGLTSYLRFLLCAVLLVLFCVGISLPFLVNDLDSLLQRIYPVNRQPFRPPYFTVLRSQTCSRIPIPRVDFTSTQCDTYEFCPSDKLRNEQSSSGEFSRHSKLAVRYLKAALENTVDALRSINPLTVIASLSWFCLGMLLMYMGLRQ